MHGFIIQSQIKSLMPDDTEMSQLISAAMQQSNNGSLRTVTVNLKCCDDGEKKVMIKLFSPRAEMSNLI